MSGKNGIAYTLIDAFTSTPFCGNSACIIILEDARSLSSETMQLIGREFNLSETVFLSSIQTSILDVTTRSYTLRWFTPSIEVTICGHATLGAAHVLFEDQNQALVRQGVNTLLFETLSGTLKAIRRADGKIELSFPEGKVEPVPKELENNVRSRVQRALGDGVQILDLSGGIQEPFQDYLIVEVDEEQNALASLQANVDAFVEMERYDIICVTAKLARDNDEDPHYICRVFAPRKGVAEDPVCGSAQCLLGPYWSNKLYTTDYDLSTLLARHVSARGGDIEVIWHRSKGMCYLRGDAIIMGRGTMFV